MCQKNKFCCCGCGLQTGTKVVGFFSLISGVLGLILLSIESAKWDFPWGNAEGNAVLAAILPFMPITGVTLEAALILSTVLLLHVAYQNDKPMRLIPWIIIRALTSIYELYMISFLGLKMIEEGPAGNVIKGDDYIFCAVLFGGINFYFWIEVILYSHQLRCIVKKQHSLDEV